MRKLIPLAVALLPITYIPLELTGSRYVSFTYVTLAVLLVVAFRCIDFKERLHIVELLFLCLGAYFVLRFGYGLAFEHQSLGETLGMLTGELARILGALILFRIGRTPAYRSGVVAGIFIALGVVLAFQLFQTMVGLEYLLSTGYANPMFSYYTGHGTMRPFSTFLNPVVYGDYLVILLSFVFWTRSPAWLKWSLLSIGSVCLLLTKTRSAWVAAIVMLVLVVAILPKKNWRVILASCSAVAALSVAAFLVIPDVIFPYLRRFLSIFNPAYSSNSIRLSLWKGTFEAIMQSPIFGYGQADYETVLRNFLAPELAVLGHPNQTILEFGFRYGLVGLLIVGAILVISMRSMPVAPLAACISFLVCALFESLWGSFGMMTTVFLLLGLGNQSLESRYSNEPYKKTLPA